MTAASAVFVDGADVDKAAVRAYLQQLEAGGSAGGGVFPITGGMVVSGRATSGIGRSDAQIELQGSVGHHTLLSMYNPDETEEAAISFGAKLADGSICQHIGQYVRFVNSNNAVATWESSWGIHNVGSLGKDKVPIQTYSNNSVWLSTGETSAAPWATLPPANSVSAGAGTGGNAGWQIIQGLVSGWCGVGAQNLVLSATNYNFLIKHDGSLNLNAPTGKGVVFCNNNVNVGDVSAAGLRSANTFGFFMDTWGTTASAANAHVADTDYVRLVTSVRAAKHDIEPITEEEARATIMGAAAVHYRSRIDKDQRRWAGFIADDMAALNEELATFDEKGNVQSVTYDRIPAYIVPLLQAHEREIAQLKARL